MKTITRTKVKVLQAKGAALLVEFTRDEQTDRKYIPADKLGDGMVADEVLDMGIPYGYPWEEIELMFDREKLAKNLHDVGIWTAADALKYPQKLSAALYGTLAENLSQILKIAYQENKGVKNG
jgi:hypothetical protein